MVGLLLCPPTHKFQSTVFTPTITNIAQVRTWRPDYASEIRQLEDGLHDMKQRKNPAKINLRQFFGANVKFQKNLRRLVIESLLHLLYDKLSFSRLILLVYITSFLCIYVSID